MFESKTGVLFIGGVGFFALAFLGNVVVPIFMYRDMPEKTVEQMIQPRIRAQFVDLSTRYVEPFEKAFGEPTDENLAKRAATRQASLCRRRLLALP